MGEKASKDLLATTRRPLGRLLLDGGFVSQDELHRALDQQRQTSEQLGTILVGMDALSEADLRAVLAVQKEFTSLADTLQAVAGVRELLGEILLKVKRLTPEALEEALAEQVRTGEKLGAILLRRGILTPAELDAVLAFQERQGKRSLEASPLNLGEVLILGRMISRERVEEALDRQKRSRRKLGEVLVEAGYVDAEQLDKALQLQQRLLAIAVAAALSFGAMVLP